MSEEITNAAQSHGCSADVIRELQASLESTLASPPGSSDVLALETCLRSLLNLICEPPIGEAYDTLDIAVGEALPDLLRSAACSEVCRELVKSILKEAIEAFSPRDILLFLTADVGNHQ